MTKPRTASITASSNRLEEQEEALRRECIGAPTDAELALIIVRETQAYDRASETVRRSRRRADMAHRRWRLALGVWNARAKAHA